MRKYALVTFGCKVNQYESQKIAASLSPDEFCPVDDWHEADLIIVNSCVVTQKSETKNRRLIRKMKRENPDAFLVAAGCLAEMGPVEGADSLVGSRDKVKKILDLFHAGPVRLLDSFGEKTRAFIKIQDGCNQFCSYCIIPYTRGRESFVSVEKIKREAQSVIRNGYREIVLTGIHLGRHPELTGLVEMIAELPGLDRLRLSSIEIIEVRPELLTLMRDHPKVMGHLHIPLQSGSGRILEAMNRPYSEAQMYAKLDEIRAFLPSGGLTTDMIAGFPGERTKDREQSAHVIREYAFHRVHLFPFSPRPGTKAALLTGRLIREEMDEALALIKKAEEEGKAAFVRRLSGMETSVLVEEKTKKGLFEGYTPEYLRVRIAQNCELNTIVPVTLSGDMIL